MKYTFAILMAQCLACAAQDETKVIEYKGLRAGASKEEVLSVLKPVASTLKSIFPPEVHCRKPPELKATEACVYSEGYAHFNNGKLYHLFIPIPAGADGSFVLAFKDKYGDPVVKEETGRTHAGVEVTYNTFKWVIGDDSAEISESCLRVNEPCLTVDFGKFKDEVVKPTI